ncbi:MAG: rhodanese-like domain-containing protein [Kofleriaceae bacterium]
MVTEVTVDELTALVSTRNVDLIDVRDPSEWETGHIAGARLVPLDQLRADPDAALVRDTTIVFICAKGVRSMSAAKLAERFGYEHVYNLVGGTKEWARSGQRLVVDRAAA